MFSIAQDTDIELTYGQTGEDYLGEVDCRLLFLGSNHRQLLHTHRLIADSFANASAGDLLERLNSSTAVRQLYEVGQEQGRVCVRMRDAIFYQPGTTDGLELWLKISRGQSVWTAPLPLACLPALGTLLPLLLAGHPRRELEAGLRSKLSEEETAWALEVTEALGRNGLLRSGAVRRNYFSRSRTRPRVTFVGHTSLLLQSQRSALLIDPLLLPQSYGQARESFDLTALRLGAICLTHSHWDHCNLQTLLRFDKDIPVIVPIACVRPSAFNPPIAPVLTQLGFTDIREAALWEPMLIEDIELIPTPFFGEEDEPGAEIDHYTYVLRTGGQRLMTLYGGVDCFRDAHGDMREVLRVVREKYQPQIAFLPVSKMVYEYRHGGVNAFCRFLDERSFRESFQYTAGPEDTVEWLKILKPRWFVPYATFTLSRKAAPAIHRTIRDLLRPQRDACFYPLRPLDSLDLAAVNGAWAASLRRRFMLLWSGINYALTHGIKASRHYHSVGQAMGRAIRQTVKRRFDVEDYGP